MSEQSSRSRHKIPQQFIDDLIARLDIVEVIDRRVPLRKAGREYTACCPFHQEKTPSFTVSPDKQFYHCFGCGAHGTAIGFLMAFENMGFVEAVEDLAAQAGIPIPREAGEGPAGQHAPLYDVLGRTAAFYRRALPQHPRARTYLETRGLDDTVLEQYQIGYAPAGWDALLRALGSSPEERARLTTAGLTVEKREGGHYDRFRDRIMFPIHDSRGRVIGFGGRIIDQGEPKYLNSPETPVFHKGRALYGLYQARKAERRLARLLVVEGYMDVVALAKHGIPWAVATLGTSTTSEHLSQLLRLAPELVFCFDGDAAGRRAAWRALENALPQLRDGCQLRFLFLPEGEDPDSLVRKEGRAAFEARVGEAMPLSTLLFDHLLGQVDTSSLDGRARLVELAKPMLSNVSASIYREMLMQKLADLAGLDAATLSRFMQGAHIAGRQPTSRPVGNLSPVRQIVAMLVQHPRLAKLAEATHPLRDLDLPGVGLVIEMVDLLRERPHLTHGALLEHWRDTETGRALERLATFDLMVPEDGLENAFRDAMQWLHRQRADRRADELLRKARQNPLSSAEKQELRALLQAKHRRPSETAETS